MLDDTATVPACVHANVYTRVSARTRMVMPCLCARVVDKKMLDDAVYVTVHMYTSMNAYESKFWYKNVRGVQMFMCICSENGHAQLSLRKSK
jgi:hypothetical protein